MLKMKPILRDTFSRGRPSTFDKSRQGRPPQKQQTGVSPCSGRGEKSNPFEQAILPRSEQNDGKNPRRGQSR